jgi:hypothetical protein
MTAHHSGDGPSKSQTDLVGRVFGHNVLLEFRGEKKTVYEWAEVLGLNLNMVRSRLWKGWPVEKSLTAPVDVRKRNKKKRG